MKPRLLGHWGTTPGLNFLYAHLNRVIRARDLNMIFVCGPGHGGPAMVANSCSFGPRIRPSRSSTVAPPASRGPLMFRAAGRSLRGSRWGGAISNIGGPSGMAAGAAGAARRWGRGGGASGSAAGVESTPVNLSGLLHLGATYANVPGGTAHWTSCYR